MKVTYELNLTTFEAWSGGEDTLGRILDEGKEKDFLAMLEELYPDGIDETHLNDLLRFEEDWIYESLGMKTDAELEEDAEEARAEIAEAAKAETFTKFCDSFSDCDHCPLCDLMGFCEDLWKEWKKEGN